MFSMTLKHVWVCCLCAALLVVGLVAPAAAFTSESLDIDVLENGDTFVTFKYRLTWYERIAVYLQLVDPAEQLESALESSSRWEVDSTQVSQRWARFLVNGFTTVTSGPGEGETTYETPGLDFSIAGSIAAEQHPWIYEIIKYDMDFSPEVTTITFPDGEQFEFEDLTTIPSTTWIVEDEGKVKDKDK